MADPSSIAAAPGSTSSSLIRGVKAQDAEAWRRLLECYSPLVYRWCRRRGLSHTVAIDLLQNVFQAVFMGLPGFQHDQPESTFRGWLRAITRNKIADHFRARKGQPPAVGGTGIRALLEQIPTPGSAGSDGAAEADPRVRRAIEEVQAEFEPRTWQAFWLTSIDGFSCDEVAAELGMTPAAVRNAKYKVRRRFRELL